MAPFRGHGTIIYFEPDETIFKTTHFDPALIKAHLEDMSYIHSGLKITFKNEITKETFDLTHSGGIAGIPALAWWPKARSRPLRKPLSPSSAPTATRWRWPCSGPSQPMKPSAPM